MHTFMSKMPQPGCFQALTYSAAFITASNYKLYGSLVSRVRETFELNQLKSTPSQSGFFRI